MFNSIQVEVDVFRNFLALCDVRVSFWILEHRLECGWTLPLSVVGDTHPVNAFMNVGGYKPW